MLKQVGEAPENDGIEAFSQLRPFGMRRHRLISENYVALRERRTHGVDVMDVVRGPWMHRVPVVCRL